ncbi:hypothetical protein I6N90_24195 [Paenibacillus sp. GSMTC-2017]|nr:hypothetical protein [Paenibacillus sp. GSMTC-2017]
MLGNLHELLLETNGEMKQCDVIIIGHIRASDGILIDYSDKVGLRVVVVEPKALWYADEDGNQVHFVWAALEGSKKRNKFVDIHIKDAIRCTSKDVNCLRDTTLGG